MILGHFLHQISLATPAPVQLHELEPGSVVVAVAGMQTLRETGLPCAIRFGIVAGADEVICQCCESESDKVPEHPHFFIRKLSATEFAGEGGELFPCYCTAGRTPESVLQDAQMRESSMGYYQLRSYPGDDFAAECLTGRKAEELICEEPAAGQHWWTPLEMSLNEALKWVGIAKFEFKDIHWLSKLAAGRVFNQTHHGIAIEGKQVIHFSTRRVPNESNRIKADSLQEFRSIGNDETSGSAVKYKEETPQIRLISRNRAVWIFCHADSWGKYNLMHNNCEHFSRYCRKGKKESRQVKGAIISAIGDLASLNTVPTEYRLCIRVICTLLSRGGAAFGRPEPEHQIPGIQEEYTPPIRLQMP